MKACMRKTTAVAVAIAVSQLALAVPVSAADTENRATIVTDTQTAQYKDSWYFVARGVKYLAVHNVGTGGLTLLKSNNGSDSEYVRYRHMAGILQQDGLRAMRTAPTIVVQPDERCVTVIYTAWQLDRPWHEHHLRMANFCLDTGRWSSDRRVSVAAGGLGLTDPTVFRDEKLRRWYLIAARWEHGVPGVRLTWSSADTLEGTWTAPRDLLDGPNADSQPVDRHRGADIDNVVEAPAWSIWDKNGDKNKDFYWSIGPSDPCGPAVSAIRRGDLVMSKSGTPYVNVWYPHGGKGDIMASGVDCYHATHPDFTESGGIRFTTSYNGRFAIANLSD